MKENRDNRLEARFNSIVSAHREGRFAEAEKGYRKLLKTRPRWGRVLNALGNLFLDQERPDKAKPFFERAARLSPPDLSACYNLGRLKQLENDHSGAIGIYRLMLEYHPESGLVWNNLGVAFRETGKPEDALDSFQKAVKFSPDMAEAWNNLGVALDEQGRAGDAAEAYRNAIETLPDYVSPRLNLGISLQSARQFTEAEAQFRKVLEIQPESQVARFLLQSITGDETPDAPPVEHVRNIFDQCAEKFETILVDTLEYKTPERLFEEVRPHLSRQMVILDLGCGTGLGAELYRPFAQSLVGADVSAKMLEKAYQKRLYDRLERTDILQDWTFPETFDLIYSSDVFVYAGNLDPVIGSASGYLAKGGILAFSVEKLDDSGENYHLHPTGRYAPSRAYIEETLSRYGLTAMEICEADIRNQSGAPVRGLLVVARKNER